MKTMLLIIMLIISLTITACDNSTNPDQSEVIQHPVTLDDILALAVTRRETIARRDYNNLAQFTEGRASMLDVDAIRLLGRRTRQEHITLSDAIADTNSLFNALAGFYALYIYYGGDDVFLPIRDNIIEIINTQNGKVLVCPKTYVVICSKFQTVYP